MFIHAEKFHNLGNTILIVKQQDGLTPEVLQGLADPLLGVGFDQCFILDQVDPDQGEISLRIMNSDGSFAQQCVNGFLCLGAYLRQYYDRIIWRFSGTILNVLHVFKEYIQLHLQSARWDEALVGRAGDWNQPVMWSYQGKNYPWTACSVGNPHGVIFVDTDPWLWDKDFFYAISNDFKANNPFRDGVNVTFAYSLVEQHKRYRLRTFERGVGETLACGSATAATAAICAQVIDKSEGVYILEHRLGILDVEVSSDNLSIKGYPCKLFTAQVSLEDAASNRALGSSSVFAV